MAEIFTTVRVLGIRRLLRLFRAYRAGMLGIISGFYTTRTMQALFNVGFFDEMQRSGRVNVESFAAAKGLDARILTSLCDSLFSLRILNKTGPHYSLDSKGRTLVEVARGWFDSAYGYEDVFHSLEALLKRETRYGHGVTRRVEFVTKGYGEVEKWFYFPLALDVITKGNARTVLDLGCGDATFLRYLCQADDRIRGYGVDIAPAAVTEGTEKIKQAGLDGRLRLFVGDVSKMESLPDELKGVDVATIFFVLHEVLFHGRDRVIGLLRRFRELFDGVPLIVFEVVRPTPEEMRKRPGMAIHYFLHHDLSDQKPVGREEWLELFRAAGFTSIEERHFGLVRTAIFTLRS
jgi:SAM-dependent methyltransferase